MPKPIISLVVAAADNNVIGFQNAMPWHIPEDFRHFKAVTMGKPCVMGRKTFDSILATLGKPLPGRVNIVISRANRQYDGALTCKDLDEALAQATKTGTDEICVIGGGQVYEQALPLANRIYLTRVHQSPQGDTLFPALDESWKVMDSDPREGFTFLTLER